MANGLETSDETLSRLVRYFESSEQETDESRTEAESSRDFYDGKQWSSADSAKLEARNQPVITDNKIKDKVDTLLGMEIAVRTDPKAFPRNPADEGASEAATDGLRFVADNNFLPQIKSEVGNNIFVEGTGCATVTVDQKGLIRIKQVMWDRFFYDYHSRKKDFSDAKYMGEAIWMDLEDAKAKYKDAEGEFDNAMSEAYSKFGETYADKPIGKWVDYNRKRVRVVEIYYREGRGWKRAVIGRYSMLEGPDDSVYLDDEGDTSHPYVARSAYVDRDGWRYGVVRRYKDLQEEHNKRRSKMLHLASARTIVADAGSVDSVPDAKTELAKPDGWVTKNPGKSVEILSNEAEISAHTQLLLQTDLALSTTGPNAALSGQSIGGSGRAKQIDQQAGQVPLGPVFDGLKDWELRVYRKIWQCIRQFWTDEKWIRVRDDERNLKFVSLNHKKTQGEAFEELAAEAEKVGGPPPPPPPDPQAPLLDSNGNPIIENDVADLDVDIIIEQAPDIITIQQEQFQELSQMAQSGLPIPPDVIIEASSLRNKKQILATLRGETPEQQQQQQMQQQLEQLAMQVEAMMLQLKPVREQAEIEKVESETQENQAQAGLSVVEAFRAGEGEEKIG